MLVSEGARVSTPFYNLQPYVYAFCIEDSSTGSCASTIGIDVGGTDSIFGPLFWSDGEVSMDPGPPYSSDQSVATITQGPWNYNVNGQNVGNSTTMWTSQYYPYTSNGDQTTFFAQVQVQVNYPCFAILKYRPLKFGPITSPWNHAFWWIQIPGGANYVTEGGPSGDCLPDCGYLNHWVVSGSTGNYPESNPNAPTAWQTGLTSAVCNQVASLLNFAGGWPDYTYPYYPTLQNSNTYAHQAANAAPFSPTQPPSTPGW